MKSIISLSLVALSLQGIILGQPKMQPTLFRTDTGVVNQVNQIPVTNVFPHPIRFNPLLYPRYINPINVIRPVTVIPQPMNLVPVQQIVQPIVTSVQPEVTSVQPTVQPVVTSVQPVMTPIDNNNFIVDSGNRCRVSGIYKQLCLSTNIHYNNEMTQITYNRKYDCFDKAICTFRNDKCHWFQTKSFKRCIKRIKVEEELSQVRPDNYYN